MAFAAFIFFIVLPAVIWAATGSFWWAVAYYLVFGIAALSNG